MVYLRKKVLCFLNEHALLYNHITDFSVRQKPVQNSNKKSLKNQGFQGLN